MDQRGRKSLEGQISNVVHLPGQWPDPPEYLTDVQKESWREIVRTKPCSWFGPDTYPLLAEYVRVIETANKLAKMLDAFEDEWLNDPAGLKRYQTLADLQNKNGQSLVRLATKMRLAQQSQYTEKTAATAAKSVSGARPWERPKRN